MKHTTHGMSCRQAAAGKRVEDLTDAIARTTTATHIPVKDVHNNAKAHEDTGKGSGLSLISSEEDGRLWPKCQREEQQATVLSTPTDTLITEPCVMSIRIRYINNANWYLLVDSTKVSS